MSTPPSRALRSASLADARLLFEWRNDPASRAASRNRAPIEWDEHCAWLRAVLASPLHTTWVAEEDGRPAGVVRAEVGEGATTLSWTTAPEARGRGLAIWMVTELAGRLNGRLRAEIRSSNEASARVAQAAGLRMVMDSGEFQLWERVSEARKGS